MTQEFTQNLTEWAIETIKFMHPFYNTEVFLIILGLVCVGACHLCRAVENFD